MAVLWGCLILRVHRVSETLEEEREGMRDAGGQGQRNKWRIDGGRGKKVVATAYDRHPSNCKTLTGTSHVLKRLSDKPHLASSLTVLKWSLSPPQPLKYPSLSTSQRGQEEGHGTHKMWHTGWGQQFGWVQQVKGWGWNCRWINRLQDIGKHYTMS